MVMPPLIGFRPSSSPVEDLSCKMAITGLVRLPIKFRLLTSTSALPAKVWAIGPVIICNIP